MGGKWITAHRAVGGATSGQILPDAVAYTGATGWIVAHTDVGHWPREESGFVQTELAASSGIRFEPKLCGDSQRERLMIGGAGAGNRFVFNTKTAKDAHFLRNPLKIW